jgi:hypothetical protein
LYIATTNEPIEGSTVSAEMVSAMNKTVVCNSSIDSLCIFRDNILVKQNNDGCLFEASQTTGLDWHYNFSSLWWPARWLLPLNRLKSNLPSSFDFIHYFSDGASGPEWTIQELQESV